MTFDFIRRLFSSVESPEQPTLTEEFDSADLDWMIPPRDVHDSAKWDLYWRNHAEKGQLIVQMSEMLNNSESVISAMRANDLRSVLFVGNGLALEPKLFMDEGFDVTIMDLSAFAMNRIQEAIVRNNLRGECVTGDLLDASLARGPFDVIVERRTLQLFEDAERDQALAAITNRLAPRGLFVTHAHLGSWRPGTPRTHPAEEWLRNTGWPTWTPGATIRARAVLTYVTTG